MSFSSVETMNGVIFGALVNFLFRRGPYDRADTVVVMTLFLTLYFNAAFDDRSFVTDTKTRTRRIVRTGVTVWLH